LCALSLFILPMGPQAASFGSARLMVSVISVEGLKITHVPEPVVYFEDYLSVPVSITAPTGNGISRVLLHYRRKGRVDYIAAQGDEAFQPLPGGRPTYTGQATIPGDFLTGAGVEYYIEAFDLSDFPSYAGTASAPLSTALAGAGGVAAGPYVRDIGPEGALVLLPDGNPNDGNTSLSVAPGVLSSVMTFGIAQKDKTNPAIVPVGDGRAVGRAVAAYSFTGGPAVLSKPVRISLLYSDRDSTPGKVDGTDISESLLRLFYWDGATWRLVGGSVDTVLNMVSAWVPRLGLYALFPIADLSSHIFAPEEKIFTPNGDGKNDKAIFSGLTGDFEIRILNEAGHLIRTIRDVAEWDGRDVSGRTVDNGLYLYQYRSELSDEWVSGLIAVAK
jgi:hypothetical protein